LDTPSVKLRKGPANDKRNATSPSAAEEDEEDASDDKEGVQGKGPRDDEGHVIDSLGAPCAAVAGAATGALTPDSMGDML
jgi:hypothetical protein